MTNSTLSVVSWNLLNSTGVEVCTNYAILKKAYESSVIFFDRGYKGVLEQGRLPWKSHIKLKKVISQIIDAGLAVRQGEGKNMRIILTSKNQAANDYSKKGAVRRRFLKLDRSKDVKLQLASEVIKNHHRRKCYTIARSQAQAKKAVKTLQKKYRGLELCISFKQIAKEWQVSSSTARRTLSQISEGFGIKVKKSERTILMFCSYQQWLSRLDWWKDAKTTENGKKIKIRCNVNSCFWYNGILYYQPKTRIGVEQ